MGAKQVSVTKTYDSKCYELAEHFLDEEFSSRPDFTQLCHRLAQLVQETVEDFYAEISESDSQ